MPSQERQLEDQLIDNLRDLKYEHRADVLDRGKLERNFREKFEAINRVCLANGKFSRLHDEIITPDFFTAARTLCKHKCFVHVDGTQLNHTLVNIKDWCKNTYEIVSQLRINSNNNSHHWYYVILCINCFPVSLMKASRSAPTTAARSSKCF